MTKENSAQKNGLRALRKVENFLSDLGWNPQKTENTGVLLVDFMEDNIPVSSALFDVRIDYERFLGYFNFRDKVSDNNKNEVIEFITRANHNLVIGNFEFNMDNGTVRFKSSIDFTQVELSEILIRNTIKSAMDAVEQYGDELAEVIRGEKKAVEALEKAEASLKSR